MKTNPCSASAAKHARLKPRIIFCSSYMIASELWELLVEHDQKIPAKISELKESEKITPKLLATLGFTKHEIDSMMALPFLKVRGIGPALAAKLYAEGYRSIESIPLDKLPEQSVIWLRHKPLAKIPRDLITATVAGWGEQKDWLIAGSYRRGAPTSGDIDILYFGKNLQQFLATLKMDIYNNGPHKVSGILTTPRGAIEVDIWVADESNKDSMLLYTTGSKKNNVMMRMVAKRKGFKLSQYGLFKADGVRVATNSEEDLFEALGLKYRAPEKR